MARVNFIDVKYLKQNTIIDGSVDPDKIVQYIYIAQDIHLQNYLGTALYDRLQEGVENDDLNADEITLLNDYVADCLAHFAAAEYMPFSAYQINNGGVYRHTSENAQNTSRDDVDNLAKKERSYAEYYAKRMVEYLCNNSSLFPEYTATNDSGIYPSKKVMYTGGWYIGGKEIKDKFYE